MEHRKYFTFDPAHGYPKSRHISYECLICGEVVSSEPPENIGCTCGNVFIDVDAGRLSVGDEKKMRAFRKGWLWGLLGVLGTRL
jgi:hypothetical protein